MRIEINDMAHCTLHSLGGRIRNQLLYDKCDRACALPSCQDGYLVEGPGSNLRLIAIKIWTCNLLLPPRDDIVFLSLYSKIKKDCSSYYGFSS